MLLKTVNKETFALVNRDNTMEGILEYDNAALSSASISTDRMYKVLGIAAGLWNTLMCGDGKEEIIAQTRVHPASIISVKLLPEKIKYIFKKSAGWKLRFSLFTREGDELLTLIPLVNWQKQSHDFILQINEEFENECNPFIILQALHCANCSLSMLNGGKVPALVNI